MTDITETKEAPEFDFGFENFRPMGFSFDGIVLQAAIENPKEATFKFENPNKPGQFIEKEAKPQLVILVQPTDHETKSGRPYPEYMQLTYNLRSKLGVFMEHLRNLGINIGKDPSILVGKEFKFEIKELDFGGRQPTRLMCPVGFVDDITRATTSAELANVRSQDSSPYDSIDEELLRSVAQVLDGRSTDDGLTQASTVSRDPRIIAGMVDGSLISYLESYGLLTTEDNSYVAGPALTV